MALLSTKENFEKIFLEFYNNRLYEDYLEALNDFVEEHDINVDIIKSLLSEKILVLLKEEATKKNLLKRRKLNASRFQSTKKQN